jgi:vacuolar-type H+-ATPase subunit F/Vma7
MAIGGKDLVAGFALAGLETRRAETPREAAHALRRAADSGEYGIVIIDETLSDEFDSRTAELLTGCELPVVVPVAGEMQWRDEEVIPHDDYINNLIRQAIGYELRIKV